MRRTRICPSQDKVRSAPPLRPRGAFVPTACERVGGRVVSWGWTGLDRIRCVRGVLAGIGGPWQEEVHAVMKPHGETLASSRGGHMVGETPTHKNDFEAP